MSADYVRSIKWSEEEAQFVEEALRCVDKDQAGHWPTVAGWLACEVRRLRADRNATPDAATLREQIAWLSADDLADAWHSTVFPTEGDVQHHVDKVMAVLAEHGLVEREEQP